MKLIAFITLGLLVNTAFAQTPAPTPAPKISLLNRPEITVAQAEKEIQAGRYRFYSYGLVRRQHLAVTNLLKKEYGIEFSMAAGCVVSRELVARVRAYNERMEQAVFKRFGKSSNQIYDEAMQKLEQNQRAALPG